MFIILQFDLNDIVKSNPQNLKTLKNHNHVLKLECIVF